MKSITAVLFSGLVIIYLGGCSDWGNVSQKAPVSELDSIDYEIISTALNIFLSPHNGSYPANDTNPETREYFGNPNMDQLLIMDSTYIEYISQVGLDEHKWADSTDSYLTERLKYENRRKHRIDNTRITGYKTILLTGSDAKIYERLIFGGYKYLYKNYPEAWGVIKFSKPSYDMNKHEAVIYVQFNKHYLWGEGVYIWLKEVDGEWYLYDRLQLWVS